MTYPCSVNANNVNAPEYDKKYKMENNSRPWVQSKAIVQEVGGNRTIRNKKRREDYPNI